MLASRISCPSISFLMPMNFFFASPFPLKTNHRPYSLLLVNSSDTSVVSAEISSLDSAQLLLRCNFTSATSNTGLWTIYALEIRLLVTSGNDSIKASNNSLTSLTVVLSVCCAFATDSKRSSFSISAFTFTSSHGKRAAALISPYSNPVKNDPIRVYRTTISYIELHLLTLKNGSGK